MAARYVIGCKPLTCIVYAVALMRGCLAKFPRPSCEPVTGHLLHPHHWCTCPRLLTAGGGADPGQDSCPPLCHRAPHWCRWGAEWLRGSWVCLVVLVRGEADQGRLREARLVFKFCFVTRVLVVDG